MLTLSPQEILDAYQNPKVGFTKLDAPEFKPPSVVSRVRFLPVRSLLSASQQVGCRAGPGSLCLDPGEDRPPLPPATASLVPKPVTRYLLSPLVVLVCSLLSVFTRHCSCRFAVCFAYLLGFWILFRFGLLVCRRLSLSVRPSSCTRWYSSGDPFSCRCLCLMA